MEGPISADNRSVMSRRDLYSRMKRPADSTARLRESRQSQRALRRSQSALLNLSNPLTYSSEDITAIPPQSLSPHHAEHAEPQNRDVSILGDTGVLAEDIVSPDHTRYPRPQANIGTSFLRRLNRLMDMQSNLEYKETEVYDRMRFFQESSEKYVAAVKQVSDQGLSQRVIEDLEQFSTTCRKDAESVEIARRTALGLRNELQSEAFELQKRGKEPDSLLRSFGNHPPPDETAALTATSDEGKPSEAPSRVPSLLARYHDKKADANMYYERLSELHMLYLESLVQRDLLRDRDDAVEITDQEFEAQHRARQKALEASMVAADEEATQLYAQCIEAGIYTAAPANFVDTSSALAEELGNIQPNAPVLSPDSAWNSTTGLYGNFHNIHEWLGNLEYGAAPQEDPSLPIRRHLAEEVLSWRDGPPHDLSLEPQNDLKGPPSPHFKDSVNTLPASTSATKVSVSAAETTKGYSSSRTKSHKLPSTTHADCDRDQDMSLKENVPFESSSRVNGCRQ